MRLSQISKTVENGYVFDNIISLVTIVIFAYIWYSILMLRCHNESTIEIKELQVNLKEVVLQLNTLWKKHSRLLLKLQEFPGIVNSSTIQKFSPPGLNLKKRSRLDEYETVRRRITTNTKELWYFVLKKATKNVTKLRRRNIVEEVANRKRTLLSDQNKLSELDGREQWRRLEAAYVSDLVQRRLHHLQNPPDCRVAKKLVCKHDVHGFGCNLHHIVYCLVIAYSLQRTLILEHYDYNNTKNTPIHQWNNIFHPLSKRCTNIYSKDVFLLSDETSGKEVVYLPYLRDYKDLRIFPYYIPQDLANRIARFNGDPYSWWIGQMVKYILRLQSWNFINETIAKINFKSPVVGVHIRRTDKLKYEALYHPLEEYMYYVEDYYKQLELTQTVDRRVYLATDDVSVLKEATEKFPQYTFYGDYLRAETASVESRDQPQSLSDFLIDLHLLSLCDHVVCTFSSNIGRMVLELMQTREADATNRFTSLDHMYYFTVKEKHYRVAVMQDKYMPLKIDDTIEYKSVRDSIFDIYFRSRTGGLIPWYKTEELIMQYPYPEYQQVPFFPEAS